MIVGIEPAKRQIETIFKVVFDGKRKSSFRGLTSNGLKTKTFFFFFNGVRTYEWGTAYPVTPHRFHQNIRVTYQKSDASFIPSWHKDRATPSEPVMRLSVLK